MLAQPVFFFSLYLSLIQCPSPEDHIRSLICILYFFLSPTPLMHSPFFDSALPLSVSSPFIPLSPLLNVSPFPAKVLRDILSYYNAFLGIQEIIPILFV